MQHLLQNGLLEIASTHLDKDGIEPMEVEMERGGL